MLNIITKVFGSANERYLKRVKPDIAKIAGFEPTLQKLSNEQLKAQTAKLRQKLDQGASLDDIKHEAFATVREASWRVLKMRHYDVQMIGGLVLHDGMIAEMRTGEGKTLVATSPLYLNALAGKGAHLVTVNDYLAQRDAEWMGRVYGFLGLSTGIIVANLSDDERRAAYASDITYGTNNEFGFDYLRDNMKYSLADYVQRSLHYAIVDEVDSILIDDARTPLIISGSASQTTELYGVVNNIIPYLRRDEDYLVDEENRSVALTDSGVEHIERRLKLDNLYDPTNIEFVHHVNKALQAHTLYAKDVHYMVKDGEIIIVDENTGRPMEGRRWSDGLHQAVEAKEGVPVQQESQTYATVTFQNFFRMYGKLAGMTGTAETEAEEFHSTYKLDTMVIPTNRPIQRKDLDDVVFRSFREKFLAVVDEIAQAHERGQPVLVGTTSVEKSEALSTLLKKRKIAHEVLNAKYHEREATIVAQAGRKGSVTIATNMAGRGTDILLGGNPDFLVRQELGEPELPPGASALDIEQYYTDEFRARLEHYKKQCAAERDEVLKAGGLFIVGTERHESRRIDNQLRGRAGRQGDPGMSRFYLSLEDDLLRLFGADRIARVMDTLKMEEGVPIEHPMVTRSIESAQRKVEARNFEMRKNLLEYDDVMDVQRKTIYSLRRNVLRGKDDKGRRLQSMALDLFEDVAMAIIDTYAPRTQRPEDWNLAELEKALLDMFQYEFDLSQVHGRDGIEKHVWEVISLIFKTQRKGFLEADKRRREADKKAAAKFGIKLAPDQEDADELNSFERELQKQYLQSIDYNWRGHLQAMEQMRDGIGLQGYAQKDPKKEYKKQGFSLFKDMMATVKTSVVDFTCKNSPERVLPELDELMAPVHFQYNREGVEDDEQETQAAPQAPEPRQIVELPKVGRNDPCPCGSGLKYKSCHMGKPLELTPAQAPPKALDLQDASADHEQDEPFEDESSLEAAQGLDAAAGNPRRRSRRRETTTT